MSDRQFRGLNHNLLTESLFIERQNKGSVGQPLFSLHQEVDGLICARKTFLTEGDPTGYKWATKYLEGYQHLLKLLDAPWFRDAFDLWVRELKDKLASEATDKIRQISKGTSPAAFQAAKYLSNREYEKGSKKRGRPSTEEVAGEIKNAIRGVTDDEADFQRANLRLVT